MPSSRPTLIYIYIYHNTLIRRLLAKTLTRNGPSRRNENSRGVHQSTPPEKARPNMDEVDFEVKKKTTHYTVLHCVGANSEQTWIPPFVIELRCLVLKSFAQNNRKWRSCKSLLPNMVEIDPQTKKLNVKLCLSEQRFHGNEHVQSWFTYLNIKMKINIHIWYYYIQNIHVPLYLFSLQLQCDYWFEKKSNVPCFAWKIRHPFPDRWWLTPWRFETRLKVNTHPRTGWNQLL